jgi:hypothetical protein
MIATKLDSRRRLVMPSEFPPHSSVTIFKIDDETWIVRRGRGPKPRVALLLPDVKKLPRDPEWEALEICFAAHGVKKRPSS